MENVIHLKYMLSLESIAINTSSSQRRKCHDEHCICWVFFIKTSLPASEPPRDGQRATMPSGHQGM